MCYDFKSSRTINWFSFPYEFAGKAVKFYENPVQTVIKAALKIQINVGKIVLFPMKKDLSPHLFSYNFYKVLFLSIICCTHVVYPQVSYDFIAIVNKIELLNFLQRC